MILSFEQGVLFWWLLGMFNLFFLTYQDLTNNMSVDDRYNSFMLGSTIMLLGFTQYRLWYMLCVLLVVMGVTLYFKYKKALGVADLHTIGWMFYGFAIIDFSVLIWFVLVLISITFSYFVIMKFLLNVRSPRPFYPVLISTFLIVGVMFGLV